MIDQDLINQLQDTDPEIRKRAIRALAKTHDYQALEYLATVHRRDTDPDVRELAYKAGQYLRKNVTESDKQESIYTPSSAEQPSSKQVEVTPMQRARAKGYVDQAMDWHVREDDAKASELLTKAFIANPNLMEDSYTVGIAENITNFRGKEAVRAVMRSARSPDDTSIKGKGRASRFRANEITSTDQTFIGGMIFLGVLLLVGFNMGWVVFPFGELFGEAFGDIDLTVTAFDLVRGIEDSSGVSFTSMMIYSMWLVPIAGFAQISIGAYYLAMSLKPDKGYWQQGMFFGFASLIPVGWLYVDINADIGYLDEFGIGLSTTDFLGTGFFIGLIVGLLLLGISFMGLQSD